MGDSADDSEDLKPLPKTAQSMRRSQSAPYSALGFSSEIPFIFPRSSIRHGRHLLVQTLRVSSLHLHPRRLLAVLLPSCRPLRPQPSNPTTSFCTKRTSNSGTGFSHLLIASLPYKHGAVPRMRIQTPSIAFNSTPTPIQVIKSSLRVRGTRQYANGI
jgi:hypothetical protein